MLVPGIAILIRSQSGWIASTVAGVFLASGLVMASFGLPVLPQLARPDGQIAASPSYPVRIRLNRAHHYRDSLQVGVPDPNVLAPADVLPEGALAKAQATRSDLGTKSQSSRFGEAFSDLAMHFLSDEKRPHETAADLGQATSTSGFIRVNFSLNEVDSPENEIREQKGFLLDGEFLGNLTIRVSSSSNVYFGSSELLHALNGKVPVRTFEKIEQISNGSDRVSFNDIRMAGFDINYDGTNDYVVMYTSS